MSNLHRVFPLALLLTLLLAVSGCQTPPSHIRLYDGPILPRGQTALIQIKQNALDGWLIVKSVDQLTLENPSPDDIELLPGQHTLEVSFLVANYRASPGLIKFFAESGKLYELHGAQAPRSYAKEFFQTLAFQKWHWSCWIVESGTGKVVAGTPVKRE